MMLRHLLTACWFTAAFLLLSPAVSLADVSRQARCGEFTVAVIPDTQNYLDYRRQKTAGYPINASDLYLQQMQWIASNAKSMGGDIVFATHVGDVWQHYSEWMDPVHEKRGFKWMPNEFSSEVASSPRKETRSVEIPKAIEGFRLLSGKLPFSVVPGNHDYDALWTDPAHPPQPELKGEARTGIRHLGGLTGFQSAFSAQSDFFKNKPWYVDANDDGADSAQIFESGDCRFLHIGLQFDAPNTSLEWAARVIKKYPGLPTIITTHKYLDRRGRRANTPTLDMSVLDKQDNSPQMVWEKLIRHNDQIFLVLSGHIGGQSYSVDKNLSGNLVHQMMVDYQGRRQVAKAAGYSKQGTPLGDGWLRLLTFRLDEETPTIQARTYSTYYKKFSSEIGDYADWYKAHDGHSKSSDAEYLSREDFVIKLVDFQQRFRPRAKLK